MAHLKPPNRFAFSGRHVSYVFLAFRPGFLSLNGLCHLFSKLKLTKYYGIKLKKPDAQKRADIGVKSGGLWDATFVKKKCATLTRNPRFVRVRALTLAQLPTLTWKMMTKVATRERKKLESMTRMKRR